MRAVQPRVLGDRFSLLRRSVYPYVERGAGEIDSSSSPHSPRARAAARSIGATGAGGYDAAVSLEDSIALVRRYADALNAGDLDALDGLFADEFVLHQPSGDRRGKAAIRWFVAGVRTLRPDCAPRARTRWPGGRPA